MNPIVTGAHPTSVTTDTLAGIVVLVALVTARWGAVHFRPAGNARTVRTGSLPNSHETSHTSGDRT